MNVKEQGFLLLTSHLGDPERKPLTVAQLRTLASRARNMERSNAVRDISAGDLCAIGYDRTAAERIVGLLSDGEQLAWYLQKGTKWDCEPVTRVSERYPDVLHSRLGMDSPGCLWVKGDTALFKMPAVALVGSRDLEQTNRCFAAEAGRQAALQGFVLVSGNARGADKTAQEACLEHGGRVISVVADELHKQPLQKNVLYVAENGFDMPFSPQRALSRNRIIHSLAASVLVAQCALGKGGTWDGTQKNLRHNWSPVFCFEDGSAACLELEQQGAVPIRMDALQSLRELRENHLKFL